MKNLIIIGKGNQSSLIKFDKNFTDQYKSVKRIKVDVNKVNLKEIDLKDVQNSEFIIAIGNNYIREKVAKVVEKKFKKIAWSKYIARSSNIQKSVKISPGSMVMENVFINHNTFIGKHVLINSGSIIEHDNKFDNYSSCGPGVVTGGEVFVGKKTFIGLGSRIRDKIEIKKNSIIGLGSNIIANCKEKSIYFGNPAKYIKENNKESHF